LRGIRHAKTLINRVPSHPYQPTRRVHDDGNGVADPTGNFAIDQEVLELPPDWRA
jgi:hypothetical protein